MVVGFLCLLDYPSVFGRWENYTVAKISTELGPSLTFQIGPAGPIIGRVTYALADLGYYTADWLGWTRAAFRLPVLVAGTVATALFFMLAGRSFGFWAAVVGSLGLVLNPMFLVYWHQLFVPMFSMLFLLLVVERVQYLETSALSRRRLVWGVVTLAPAYVFALIHYGPVRILGAVVIGYWVTQVAWRAVVARREGRPYDRASLVAVPAVAVLVVVFALLLDQRNAEYFVTPDRLVATPRTEIVRSAEDVTIVQRNLPIVLTAFLPALNLAPERFGDFITDLIVDYRYYVISMSMLPLALLGLGVVVSQISRSSFARLTLLLLIAASVGPVFSSEYDGQLTISSPRMFFAVAPLYLCVAAGAGWLLTRRRVAVRAGAAVLLVALLALQAATIGAEVARHRAFIDDLAARWWTNGGEPPIFDDRASRRTTDEDERLTNGSYRYYLDFGSVVARAIAREVVANAPWPEDPEEILIVRLDGVLPRGNKTLAIQVVFELRELGLAAAWFEPDVGRLQGAGSRRPAVVIVAREEAARQAREVIRQGGSRVDRWTLKVPD